jgi:hypothetical protein
MSQNTSSAVMAQRVEPPDSLDFFPTPPWATRALCRFLVARNFHGIRHSCWEPACGDGAMARPLGELFTTVYVSDVHDYGWNHAVGDFLFPGCPPRFDWIITNPPFRLAAGFARTALTQALCGVALLVRTAFLESAGRYRELFAEQRPNFVLQFCERVPIFKGRLDPKGSSATAYCWLVWDKAFWPCEATVLDWVPPCRKELERPGDYGEANDAP